MRRKDREITNHRAISDIIKGCQVLRLGLSKDNTPYIIPLSFGYDGEFIYFHTASEGRKIDYMTANNSVCFEFDHNVSLVTDENTACNWTFTFQSVVGYGTVHEITDRSGKAEGLNHIMEHYSGKSWKFGDAALDQTRVWRITNETITGKQSKDRF